MRMTIYYIIQLKLYFHVSTIILIIIYTEIYMAYIFSISIVHNNHSVEVSLFWISSTIFKDKNEFLK